jgi:lipopolysaccharide/colanic/teichoic acid biosynthesis glycosyltransferase
MEPVTGESRYGLSVATSIATLDLNTGHLVPAYDPPRTATRPTRWWRTEQARRLINLLLAVLLLVAVAPLMLLIGLVVRLTSRGPVLYKQPRIGIDRRQDSHLNGNWRRKFDHGGKVFQIYKFRTMYRDSDRSGQVWATADDPRITPVGRVLRRYRLDELPQLFNVLRGDMNLVGPRPEQPRIFAELRQQIDLYPTRQKVLPGITGWAQINQRYDSCLEDVKNKVRFDLEYIRRRSALEDIRILARTVPVVIFQRER